MVDGESSRSWICGIWISSAHFASWDSESNHHTLVWNITCAWDASGGMFLGFRFLAGLGGSAPPLQHYPDSAFTPSPSWRSQGLLLFFRLTRRTVWRILYPVTFPQNHLSSSFDEYADIFRDELSGRSHQDQFTDVLGIHQRKLQRWSHKPNVPRYSFGSPWNRDSWGCLESLVQVRTSLELEWILETARGPWSRRWCECDREAGTIGRYVRALAVSPWISTICGFVEGMESDGSCFFM